MIRFPLWFLIAVLLVVNLYSVGTLMTKPAYWYDEALNVELARNFADFGKLDLIVAPDTFSGRGATVGSTGYPITVPLAGFFKVFGFGLAQARIFMLLWMSACLLVLFFVAQKLWGHMVAYGSTLLVATFAPFYGNGRSVMGEIPGFLFFLLSFYFLEKEKWWQSGVLLGLAVVSKPSVFIFLIPAYMLVLLCRNALWKDNIIHLAKVGSASLTALVPWFLIYWEEILEGSIVTKIVSHFTNPYQEAGLSIWTNVSHNLSTFFHSSTLVYFLILFLLVIAALYLDRALVRTHRSIFILSAVYLPLIFFQYLKSAGYLRYLIAAEFLVFILFLLALPILTRRYLPATIALLVVFQCTHLLWFSDIYAGERTQKTLSYLSSAYPEGTIGIMNLPQVGSFIASDRKYQYLSTYGLWQFGVNPLLLPFEQIPGILVADSDDPAFSSFYAKDTAFSEGFTVYRRKK